jgi:hypothetical protein
MQTPIPPLIPSSIDATSAYIDLLKVGTSNTDNVASKLKSVTTLINIAAATAPTNGQVLTATSSTSANWQTISSGGTPGLPASSIQFNSSPPGTFTGDSRLTYNPAATMITIGAETITAQILTPAATIPGNAGGYFLIGTGDGNGTGNGGTLLLQAGSSGFGPTGNGGETSVHGGTANSTNGNGGLVSVIAGDGSGSGAGGDILLQTGTGTSNGRVLIPTATNSSSITTGSLVVTGGVGISENVYVGQDIFAQTNDVSGSGSLYFPLLSFFSGGYVSLNNKSSNLRYIPSINKLIIADLSQTGIISTVNSGGSQQSGSVLITTGNCSNPAPTSGFLHLQTGDCSGTGATGPITVQPGTATSGIGGNVNISGGHSGSGTGGNVILQGGSGLTTGKVSVPNNTASTTTTTGALVVTGGVGIGGSLHVGGTVSDGTFATVGGVVTGATITDVTDNVAANSLKSATTFVNVSAAIAPTVGQVLTATNGTTASWQSPAPFSFADFYALMPGDNAATVAPGSGIFFPQNGPVVGTDIVRFSGTGFTLVSTGYYEVQWQVSIDEPGQTAVAINGTMVSFTVVSRATGTTQMVGLCIISATAGDTLQIINATGNSTALTITPGTGAGTSFNPISAHLVIKRLA